MLYKCGDIKFKRGTFTTSGSSVTNFTVNLGFKPKYVAIYFNGSSGTMGGSSVANGALRYIYDADINPSYGFRSYRSSSSSIAVNMAEVSTSGDTRICEITNTGFVWRNAAATQWNGTYYYFAIG